MAIQPESFIHSDSATPEHSEPPNPILYRPFNAQDSATLRFARKINKKYRTSLRSYEDLLNWSTSHIGAFWDSVWDETDIIGTKGQHIVDNVKPSLNPRWFGNAKLNWAENMLWCRSSEKTALMQATEPTPDLPNPPIKSVSYAQLYELVSALVSALLGLGLKPGDRVASYSSNCIENVAACLAATAIGCIWVSAAADFAPDGVFERFQQIKPAVIFAVDAVVYNAKVHPHLPKLSTLLADLSERASINPTVVIIHTIPQAPSGDWSANWTSWEHFVAAGRAQNLGKTESGEIQWSRQSFDWPLWILFSSGTTGKPKPIVHRAGGMLLQLIKELSICADLTPDDVFFYYTTTGWMMWNFLVSGLAVGCTLVLYDGSPLRDPSHLFRLVDDLGITIFGTSAKYIDALSKGYKPREHHDLSSLRHMYSTGSPLSPASFDFVYRHIHPQILLASITGGTDICSLFAGMCSALPVYRGEIQCRLLGMAVDTFTPEGVPSGHETAGELVCTKPFPCMPLGFWPLPGYGSEEDVSAAQARFQDSYFSLFKGIWYHGDHVLITKSQEGNGGGMVMLGRSDGVLNPGGVRFGSAELYDVIELCFSRSTAASIEETIDDSLAVGQRLPDGDERVILFVKLPNNQRLSPTLERRVKEELRTRRSPRHVPAKVLQIHDIPMTLNGKKVEVPVKKIINGASVSSVNSATLLNPECLAEYSRLGEELRSESLR